jgi:hypothetical protein
MSKQWFSLIPTADISITNLDNTDISNIKAILKLQTVDISINGRIYMPYDLDIQSANWNQVYGDLTKILVDGK